MRQPWSEAGPRGEVLRSRRSKCYAESNTPTSPTCFHSLIQYVTSGPVVATVWQGKGRTLLSPVTRSSDRRGRRKPFLISHARVHIFLTLEFIQIEGAGLDCSSVIKTGGQPLMDSATNTGGVDCKKFFMIQWHGLEIVLNSRLGRHMYTPGCCLLK